MIFLDTTVLVASLCGRRDALPRLTSFVEQSERLGLPALVLYEWLRGPRIADELALQEQLVPAEKAVEFGPRAAILAADIHCRLGSPRRRQVDIAIAATALAAGAALWTLNLSDFDDIQDLRLV